MAARCRRDFAVLMQKNFLLKRRAPCSLLCELLLAIGYVSLLVLARVLAKDAKLPSISPELNVNKIMPVRLPECAEYVEDECDVKVVGKASGVCLKGITYGCEPPLVPDGPPGVWAWRCGGTFELNDGSHVSCHGEHNKKARKCHRQGRHDPRKAVKGSQSGGGFANMLQSMLSSAGLNLGGGSSGARRYDATFAVAPPSSAVAFRRWLREKHHPWAENVEAFDSAESVQEHVTSPGYPARNDTSNRSALLCGAVIFETPISATEVNYTLRFNTTLLAGAGKIRLVKLLRALGTVKTDSLVDHSEQRPGQRINLAGLTYYAQSGFLSIQRTVDDFVADTSLRSDQGEHKAASPSAPSPSSPRTKSQSTDAEGLDALQLADSLLGADGRPHVLVPFPTYGSDVDIFRMIVPRVLSTFLLVSMTYSMNRMITAVVTEREKRLRDGMRLMGMHAASFHLSWFCTYIVIGFIVSAGVATCLSQGGVLAETDGSLLFVWLLLFSSASTSFSLAISALFSKSKTSASVGSFIFYASSYFVLLVNPSVSTSTRRLVLLLPPANFQVTAQIFADIEAGGGGVTWATVGRSYNYYGSVLEGLLFLAFDTVIIYALFLYLDQVVSREAGLRRPWYFPFCPSAWREAFPWLCPLRDAAQNTLPTLAPINQTESSALIERDLGETALALARIGDIVELRGLRKVYSDGKVAVDALDLVMYPGEVFALLGHNGAGKTSTLSMLCGLTAPTRGRCNIFGHDLAEQPDEAQKLLGVCPQHDVLWDQLSCGEHLALFAAFKRVAQGRVQAEVRDILQRTGLGNAELVPAGNLSGGMKRRLSLGIALVGGSRLVVLDEPTSGLDPFARRAVWDLLRASKQGRVIVLSTHYMDEADILGDRVAILREGQLQCFGSPQFLKRAYSCGYNFVFVKLGAACQTDAVREAVCGHMPELSSEIKVLSDSAKELVLRLPFAASVHFPIVLSSLERQKEALSIESYGLSVTTLEEVFLKVASGDLAVGGGQFPGSSCSAGTSTSQTCGTSGGEGSDGGLVGTYARMDDVDIELSDVGESVAARPTPMLPISPADSIAAKDGSSAGSFRALAQIAVLLKKRVRYGRRDRKGLLCQLFLPTLTLILCVSLMSRRLFRSNPPLLLDARCYNAHCDASPRNVVDFSYLPSIPSAPVDKLVHSAEPFIDGIARRHDPYELLAAQSNFEDDDDDDDELLDGDQDITAEDMNAPFMRAADGLLTRGLPDAVVALRHSSGDDIGERLLTTLASAFLGESVDTVDGNGGGNVASALAEAKNVLAAVLGPRAQMAAQRNVDIGKLGERKSSERPAASRNQSQEALGNAYDGRALERNETFGRPVVARRLGDAITDAWSLASLASLAVDRVPGWRASVAGRRLAKRMHKREVKEVRHAWPPAFFMTDFSSCSNVERKLWWRLAGRAGVLPKDLFMDQVLELLRPNGLDAVIMDETLLQMLFDALDQNHDGQLTPSEFCASGRIVQRLRRHYTGLARGFSQRLLDNRSVCPRYGAFYVLTPPRDHHASMREGWPSSAAADAVLFVNTTSSHAAPVFQSVLTNARLANEGVDKRVAVTVHPLPQTQDEQKSLEQFAVFLLAIYVCFSLSFIPAGIANYIVKERSSGARQLQALSGASTSAYWIANLLYDLLLYVVPACSVMLVLRQFGFEMLVRGDSGLALAAVLAACGPAIMGFTYLATFLFKDHAKASNTIFSFCLVGAGIFSAILFVLVVINYDPQAQFPSACDRPTAESPEGTCRSPRVRMAERIVGPLFRLVPTVSCYQALFSIALITDLHAWIPPEAMSVLQEMAHGDENGTASASEKGLPKGLPKVSLSVWADEWAGEPLRYLCFEGCMYFVLALIIDAAMRNPRLARRLDRAACLKRLTRWKTGGQRRSARDLPGTELITQLEDSLVTAVDGSAGETDTEVDPGVEAERERLRFLAPEDTALHVLSLQKTYSRWLAISGGKKRAVRGISFAVHPGEVFGLLGHNGAGKTSALKCIVGEHCCTAGSVSVGGSNLDSAPEEARSKLGYCPQFDALLELLTVRDHLELFAGLRGLATCAADRALDDFGLRAMAHRRADVLSGGNRRRLSAAIALLGQPRLAVLDEPSCGLDPAARRDLWDAVRRAVGGPCYPLAQSAAAPNERASHVRSTAVLLTTHSMEEAEALSTRLGIMTDGIMAVVGTVQQIKQRRSGTYELSLTFQAESPGSLSELLQHLDLAGQETVDPSTVAALLDANPPKKRAYARARCALRAQMESHGQASASVLAEWWLQQERGEAMGTFLRSLVGEGVELVENFGAFWRFRLPSGSAALAQIFSGLEAEKTSLGISEYTLTQATLEQIFNSMAEGAAAARGEGASA